MPDLIADSTVLLLVSPSLQWSVYFSSSHDSYGSEISGFKITQKIYNLWREYCYDVYIVKQGKKKNFMYQLANRLKWKWGTELGRWNISF